MKAAHHEQQPTHKHTIDQHQVFPKCCDADGQNGSEEDHERLERCVPSTCG